MIDFKPSRWKVIIPLILGIVLMAIHAFVNKNVSFGFGSWVGIILSHFVLFYVIWSLVEIKKEGVIKQSKLAITSFVFVFIGILPPFLERMTIFSFKFLINFFNKFSFVFLLLVLIGFIMAIISLCLIKRDNLKGKEFAWASIIIVLVFLIMGIIIGISSFSMGVW